MLVTIGISPDGFIGHSFGELCCAYIDGCMTAEQVMLMTYYRGVVLKMSKLKDGVMAAIGKSSPLHHYNQ